MYFYQATLCIPSSLRAGTYETLRSRGAVGVSNFNQGIEAHLQTVGTPDTIYKQSQVK